MAESVRLQATKLLINLSLCNAISAHFHSCDPCLNKGKYSSVGGKKHDLIFQIMNPHTILRSLHFQSES